jgi:hypothetical protein
MESKLRDEIPLGRHPGPEAPTRDVSFAILLIDGLQRKHLLLKLAGTFLRIHYDLGLRFSDLIFVFSDLFIFSHMRSL